MAADTHSHTPYKHTHKGRLQPTVPYSHNDTVSAELTLQSHTHTHVYNAAHVYTGRTDANVLERWSCAPGTFAHPTLQSTFLTDSRVEELCPSPSCGVFSPPHEAFTPPPRPLTTPQWLLIQPSACPYSNCVFCLPPHLGFQVSCLVYMTRLGQI